LLPGTPTSAPSEPAVLPRGREPRLAGAGPTLGEPAPGPIAVRPSRPRSWVCPYCYLTNDAGATTCRGCRSSSLHL
jgi:ribosomal protein L40E